jgi:mono/diheme cytochrome c family protein
MKRTTQVLVTVAAITTAIIAMVPKADSQEAFPDEPGRDTLLLACTQCHSLGKMVAADLTADDWQFIVYDMISRGAPVHQEDIADLTKYLQRNFAADK